jgi:predicted ATPase
MHFKSIALQQWQQFQDININFHDRLTVLTGSNGCGKTTILNILARHSGWSGISLSTPKEEENTGAITFSTRVFNGEDKSSDINVGQLEYSNSMNCSLQLPPNSQAQYQLTLTGQKVVKCLYIPSHRPIFRYQAVANIPTAKKDKLTAYNEVSTLSRQRYNGNNQKNSASFFIKNALIGWAINGYGVSNNGKIIMANDEEQIQFFEGFQETLRKVLPKTLGFDELVIRNMEIVFICNGGNDEFLLETASGGISALIDIAWQIFMFSSKENSDFTVIIDEVENHLHPSMQRSLLQNLIDAFPQARFIVSTHSPLVVNSVKDSRVYALAYNDDNKITSHYLNFSEQAKTASEILDEVLGVSFTMPIWVEDNLNSIISKFTSEQLDESSLAGLRQELTDLGLETLFPYTLQSIMEGK